MNRYDIHVMQDFIGTSGMVDSGHFEDFPTHLQFCSTVTTAEKTELPNFIEPFGKYMKQKPPQKLIR